MALNAISWDMILGGFGLFMFGITFMGDGLKAVAGDKLREYIDKYTTNPISAMIIGIILTIIMQSSSATAAITIGLVRAGLMNLTQACGIILGANIGTTVTSFLISINIDKYAMYIVFLGAIMICFSKKMKTRHLGEVILGFGLLFFHGLCLECLFLPAGLLREVQLPHLLDEMEDADGAGAVHIRPGVGEVAVDVEHRVDLCLTGIARVTQVYRGLVVVLERGEGVELFVSHFH